MSSIARTVLGIAVISGALVTPTFAQNSVQLTPGIMAGVNYGKASQDPESSDFTFEYKTGWLAGAFLGIRVNDMFSIEPQAFYSVKGSDLQGQGAASSATGSVKLSYIEVPVLAKLWFPTSNSQITPFVFAGPVGEFKVGCTAEGAIVQGSSSSTDCDNTDLKVKSTSFAGTVGAGLEFKAGQQVVRIDARYTHGFTNINDDPSDNTTAKLRTFAVTAGIGFPMPR